MTHLISGTSESVQKGPGCGHTLTLKSYLTQDVKWFGMPSPPGTLRCPCDMFCLCVLCLQGPETCFHPSEIQSESPPPPEDAPRNKWRIRERLPPGVTEVELNLYIYIYFILNVNLERTTRRTGPDLSRVPIEYANKITRGHVKLIYLVTNTELWWQI